MSNALGRRFGEVSLTFGTALLGGVLLAVVATTPMAPRQQALFAGLTLTALVIANRFGGRRVSLSLAALSVAVSLRYLFWRFTETLPQGDGPEWLLGVGLLLAEVYAITVLTFGYMQTAWPLGREVCPLPADPGTWPSVDIYVTTYNEPMAIVRATLLAAMAIDWPPDRLRVWLLDDGRREEFRRFAEQIGCGYIARPDNRHAKAGNLNHALRVTDGAFVAVFDCDHIPTRAFLQLTMGWFVAQPNLALVQTSQHFYTADPFQRNVRGGVRVPAEGNLFHGLVQDGHDTWNAAMFSGSCGVLRRAALDEIGGFATGTVTEDAHTSLRLHRRGWDSAYLRIPLAAGLATEQLARHLRQRRRWARGMLQILRLDNPLFGPGLTLVQRLCYLQATGHFLFALPRVVFLTAPLALLLLGQNVIAASPLAITVYAVPHIVHALATTSRLAGRWRHSFWSEVYETVLALRLVPVTLATLVAPHAGRFGVTAKGGLLRDGFFDLRSVAPNLILAVLLLAGLIRGAIGLVASGTPPLIFNALALNVVWATLSLLTVLAALAVGREARHGRVRAEIPASLAVAIVCPDGTAVAARTSHLSLTDGTMRADTTAALRDGMDIEVRFQLAGETLSVPAHVARADVLGVQLVWEPRTLEQEADLVRAIFGRADAWNHWADFPPDRPLVSLGRVLASIGGLFGARGRRRRAIAVGAAVGVLALGVVPQAHGQTPSRQPTTRGTTVRPPSSTPGSAPPAIVTTTPARPPSAQGGLPAQPVPMPPAAAPTPAPSSAPSAPAVAADTGRHVVLNLRQLGAQGALALRGTNELLGVDFGLRADEVVTAAQLTISGAMSPALLADLSHVTVTLNDQYVGSIPASRDQPSFSTDLSVNPVFFRDINRLSFRFSGRYAPDCNDALSGLLWATIYDASTLSLTVQRLPPQRDLSRLPQPFFDPAVRQMLVLPVVLPAAPGNDALRAAAVVTSWFGAQAGFRGASFPPASEVPAHGDAVLLVVTGDGATPSVPGLPTVVGPTLAVLPNPNDPQASLLVVGGRSGEEAVAAASTLAVGSRALGGTAATVAAPALAPRLPYDAPTWISTDRPVKFGELVGAAELQSTGYTGLVHVPFRTAPDFYTWHDRPFGLNLRWRAPAGPILDVAASRLDVGINGIYLHTSSLSAGTATGWWSRLFSDGGERNKAQVAVPIYDVFGANDLQFYFDARPLHRGECTTPPGDLRMAIDPDSTIDLSAGLRFTELPNLAYFVSSGFPFTRMADLSETAVVIPDRPTTGELGVFLDLMGRMGAFTGLAATRVTVARPEAAASSAALAGHDVLLLGTFDHLGDAERLLGAAPLRLDGRRLALALPTPLDAVRRVFGDPADTDRRRVAAVLSTPITPATALLVGAESPFSAGRSVVALLAGEPTGLVESAAMLRNTEQAASVQGDVALLTGGKLSSYRIGGRYAVGSLPFWLWPGWMLRDAPIGMAAVVLAAAALLGFGLFRFVRSRALLREPAGRPDPSA